MPGSAPTDPEAALDELRRVLIRADLIVDQISQPKREELRQELITAELLVERLSPQIGAMLETQIAATPEPFARGFAPVMGEAIRRRVYQNRDDIVDALYPVIGDMINRAVTEAMRDFARSIDARLRGASGPSQQEQLAVQVGITSGEYQLRAALPFRILECFLIQRNSGILISHDSLEDQQSDRDLISGMLTAIRSFARDAFGRGEEELGAIEYQNHRILLEAGSAAYLAVVIDGIEPTDYRSRLRDTLFKIHDNNYERLLAFDGSDTSLANTGRQTLRALLRVPTRESSAVREPARQGLTGSQRAIITILLILCLVPFVACGWWLWSVESRLSALMRPQPIVVAATTLPTPTHTTTVVPSPTAPPTSTPAPTAIPATPLPTTLLPVPGVLRGNVYLRDTPSLDGANRGELARIGTAVAILGRQNEWYQIRVALSEPAGRVSEGWVLAEWVVTESPPESIQEIRP